MVASQDCIDEAAETLKPGPLVFYDLRNQMVYSSIMSMKQAGEPVTNATLHCHLRDKFPEDYKGEFLSYVANLDGTPALLSYFLGKVTEKYLLRKMIQTCTGAVASCMYNEGRVEDLIEQIERDVLDILAGIQTGRGVADINALHQNLLTKYEAAFNGQQSGLLTGFEDLDGLTGGMQPQDMIVLAGQQSTGKTSLAMNIAWNIVERGNTVGVLSLETSAEKLLHRMYSSVGRVAGARFLRASGLLQCELDSMMRASRQVQKSRDKILIDDSGGLTIHQMKAKARRLRQRGAVLLVVDYMQLLNVPGADGDTQRITSISRGIKECAKENDCPVIAISSLNREASKGERRPRTSDLRGSGQIEYDGNQVWLLDSEDQEASTRTVKLKVAKNKDGGTGEIDLVFFPAQFRFEDAANPQQNPPPYKDL
jgi:replicative DNA helicase